MPMYKPEKFRKVLKSNCKACSLIYLFIFSDPALKHSPDMFACINFPVLPSQNISLLFNSLQF